MEIMRMVQNILSMYYGKKFVTLIRKSKQCIGYKVYDKGKKNVIEVLKYT